MAVANTAPKSLAWLRKKTYSTLGIYSRYWKHIIEEKEGRLYLKTSAVNPTILASINLESGDTEFTREYYRDFPLDNPNASTGEKRQNLIDLFWILSLGTRTETPEEGILDRMGEYPNSALALALARCLYSNITINHYSGTLPSYNLVLVKISGIVSVIPKHPWYCSNSDLVWHEESNSWWPLSAFDIGEQHPRQWLRNRPIPCSSCGTPTSRGALVDSLCPNCFGVPPEKLVIHSYSQRAPSLLGFKGENKKKVKPSIKRFSDIYYNKVLGKYNPDSPMYLGIELEYECVDREVSMKQVLRRLHEHVIVKSDGSLTNGIEVVSAPATYEEQMKAFEKFFNDFPSGTFSKETCGMHVHISKEPLNATTQGKILAFMNNSENREFITKVAGRYSEGYARQTEGVSITNGISGVSGRYTTVNTSNSNTLEFRVFKSTEKFAEFSRFLQFVLAMVEYSKGIDYSYSEHKKHSNFISWLSNNRKDYPVLYSDIKEMM